MFENKKILFAVIGLIATVFILGAGFVLSKTKSKDMILTINKLYFAYSSYVVDLGHSPKSMDDLLKNQNNVAKWDGPYISKTILDNYDQGKINIVQASNIPTKACSLDYITYCYNWLKFSNLTSADFSQLKENINPKANMFFAEDNLYFRLSTVE
tara:strand:- start:4455 stop:4919 length:465 start_codon:yes stop_codon:yes gene_type:complete